MQNAQNKRKKIKKKEANSNTLSYGSDYKARKYVYTARALIQVTWGSPIPKAPYFTKLLCWLLGLPALHQPTIKRPLTTCLIEPLTWTSYNPSMTSD
jgi:hypothetical protein